MMDVEKLNAEIALLRNINSQLREMLKDVDGFHLNKDQAEGLILGLSDIVVWLEQLFVDVRALQGEVITHDN